MRILTLQKSEFGRNNMNKYNYIITNIIIVLIMSFLVYLYLAYSNINTNVQVNFTIDEFIDVSIQMCENKKNDEYLRMLKKIKKELPGGGYEAPYTLYLQTIKSNIKIYENNEKK